VQGGFRLESFQANERLEKIISSEQLRPPKRNAKWWLQQAGAFSDDPGYADVVRLGRKYHQSLKPKPRKATR
jgi:hypothetical protein